MVEIVLDECKHGIPLVNGLGCVICSNRTTEAVCVKLERGTRETRINSVLNRHDKVDEVSATEFL